MDQTYSITKIFRFANYIYVKFLGLKFTLNILRYGFDWLQNWSEQKAIR